MDPRKKINDACDHIHFGALLKQASFTTAYSNQQFNCWTQVLTSTEHKGQHDLPDDDGKRAAEEEADLE